MSAFIEYLDSTAARLRREEERLKGSDRQDEANFARIKQNICDIARTVHNVFIEKKGADFAQAYAARLAEMRARWESGRALAEEHGDVAAAVTESVKIDMMREIEAQFCRTGGESYV